ncbi:MAG: hypothetical protein DSM106950_02630 [Stigonema ocellatum SAG 48.90 = DSM 106950]|nr:hypothetical protein [Stigonema ocellatum SAG 48.90 = DSM 106950]
MIRIELTITAFRYKAEPCNALVVGCCLLSNREAAAQEPDRARLLS